MDSDELYVRIASVLSRAYVRVDWRSMTSMKRSAVDILANRIRVASYEPTFSRAIERICHGLKLSAIRADVEDIEYLMARNDEVMEAMRENTVYLALLTQKIAREKSVQRCENDEQEKLAEV